MCSQASASPSQGLDLQSADLSNLCHPQKLKAKDLLGKYRDVFSAGDSDLGCTTLIEHNIPLTDDIPTKQRYRCIPPSRFEIVKVHIKQLLQAQRKLQPLCRTPGFSSEKGRLPQEVCGLQVT